MKTITPYLPFAVIAVAIVLGVYFFYYKPKQDAKDAADAATQKAYDDALINVPVTTKFGTAVPINSTLAAKAGKINPAIFQAILNKKP